MININTMHFFVKEAKSYHKKILGEIRKLVKAGRYEEANELIQANKDFIRVTPQGSQIRNLGEGAEGVGTLVVGAKDKPYELTVRKAMDRGGALFNRENMAKVHNTFRKTTATNNPNFAKRYSKKIRKGKKGTPYTINEFVQGEGVSFSGTPRGGTSGLFGLTAPELGRKNVLTDVVGNEGNTIRNLAGEEKIIDFIPATKERMRNALLGQGPRGKQVRKRHGINLSEDQTFNTMADFGNSARVQKVVEAIQGDSALMNKLQNPQVGREGQAALLSDQWGVPVQPRDVNPFFGLRRADALRTLRGL